MTEYTPTQHSTTIGGSSAGRVMACPASLVLSKSMPSDEKSSSFATEGTALHNCVEHCLIECLSDTDVADLVGTDFHGVAMTQEHIDTCILPALRMFETYYDSLRDDNAGYVVEVQVAMPGIEGSFGTADILMVAEDRAVILDWKFGGGVYVGAEENIQMMFYAYAAAGSVPELFRHGAERLADVPDDYRIDIVIVQPRMNAEEPSVWTTSMGRLRRFHVELLKAADLAMNAAVPPYARGEHCRWCRAKPICPIYADVAKELALFKAGSAPEAPAEAAFTQDDLAHWMHLADVVRAWAKSIDALAMSEAKEGRPPTGKKLVDRLGNTSYVDKDDRAKVDKMLAKLGLKAAERRAAWVNLTPTQAKKLLKTMGLPALPVASTQRVVTGVSLVDASDKRPAVATDSQRVEKAHTALNEFRDNT